jgi:hypothetical protein
MKISRFFLLPLLAAFSFLFAGCPVSSTFPLGASNAEEIDTRLIGTWKNDSASVEASEVKIEKADAYTYKMTVVEKGSTYMAEGEIFNAWLTKLKDKTFLVLQETDNGTAKEKYYVYCLSGIGKNSITTNDITLKVGGTDAITSIQAYRDEVTASMEKEDFLAGTIVWKK